MDDPPGAGLIACGDIVHRMTVGFGNGTHGCPAGMGRDGMIPVGKIQQELENGIIADLPAQMDDIVAQAADFGGHLVNKCNGYGFGLRVNADAVVDQNGSGRTLCKCLKKFLLGQSRLKKIKFSRVHNKQKRKSG